MYKILAILMLIPALCFGESLVYIQKSPTAVATKLGPPQAFVEVAGVKVDQPIAISATGTPVWAVLVNDADLAKVSKDAAYLGKGLNEVKAKSKAVYDTLTVKQVTLETGEKVTLSGDAAVPPKGTVTATDQPIQTFAGFDPMTGGAAGIEVKPKVVK